MVNLVHVPVSEFNRILDIPLPDTTRAQIFSTLGRVNTLYMIKRAGSGHVGTSLSSLDIVSWLFLNRLNRDAGAEDIYFSSKGHDVPALYATLIGLGMLEDKFLHLLRRIDGLPGHPDVSVPYMVTNTGSLGMGISKAKGMARANRLLGKRGHIYVLLGDGELQEGQIWESLGSAVNDGITEITAIVDHNKVQSDTLVSSTSDLGDIEAKFHAFGWHVARCNGNDHASLEQAFSDLDAVVERPKLLIADTQKGSGVSFMEHSSMPDGEWLYRYHSGAPSDDDYDKATNELLQVANVLVDNAGLEPIRPIWSKIDVPKPLIGLQRLVPAYSEALLSAAEVDQKIVALDGDLVLDTGLIPFKERFPDRFFECGIAEQDMVSQAGGMALGGLLPVVHSFACFLSSRPNEHIYNNATERTKIMYVGALSGIIPGGPGHSHQSVRDVSALAAMPGLVLIQPANEREVALSVDYCLRVTNESTYLRLASVPVAVPFDLPNDYSLSEGVGVPITDGHDAVMFSYGPVLLTEAFMAAEQLRSYDIGLRVVNLPWLNRVNRDWLADEVIGKQWVFSLDDQYTIGGQGQMLMSVLATLNLDVPPKASMLGVLDIPLSGANDEVLRAHRLDRDSLVQDIATTMGLADRVR